MSFLSALDRIRRRQRLGRLLVAALAAAAAALAIALALGLLDARFGFETTARRPLVGVALAAAIALALAAAIVALRLPRQRAAALADRLSPSGREPGSTGLALAGATPETPLARHLVERALADARAAIEAIPPRRLRPKRALRLAALALLLALAPLLALRLATPEAFDRVAERLLHPARELPPWSPLDFELEPGTPRALYGGELELAATVTGAPLEAPVECLVRVAGRDPIQRLPTFRESEQRFSRKLESLTEPVEVAFAVGRARSPWTPVEILLQPKVLGGRVIIDPPAHVEREPAEMPLDSNQIAALEGATLTLELHSNRPLSTHPLHLDPPASGEQTPAAREIEGELVAADRIAYRWTVATGGTLTATLHDVRGTPAAAPLELSLRAVPDAAPVVELNSPPRMMLATPDTRIPLEGRAEDDHGLARLRLVRTLQGFRDRARVIAPSLRQKSYEFDSQLELGRLGVEPGQTLELYLEAADHNPSLLGQGASPLSRVRVISEDEYATLLRNRTTLEEFGARFNAIARELKAARESLEALRDAADAEAAADAAGQAAAAQRRAAELFEKLAADFPAYEVDERLADLARAKAAALRANLEQLDGFDPQAPGRAEAVAEMLDRLGQREQAMQQLLADGESLKQAGAVLEMAARFRQIYDNQASVTERLRTLAREIARGVDDNRRLLPSLARTQEKNREALDRFAEELRRRAEAIEDPELAPLRQSALDFLQRLALADPNSVMDLASESARLGESNDAYVSAELARSQLESLMQPPDAFCAACRGASPTFGFGSPDLDATLAQLLEAMMCQNPGAQPNQGTGGGGFGLGGTGPTGNAQPGFATLDIPVLGPERMRFDPASLGAESQPGEGRGNVAGGTAELAENETLDPVEQPRETRATPDLREVPDDYRDAIRTYFTPDP